MSRDNRVIYLSLPPTKGLSGRDWVEYFESGGRRMKEEERSVLLSRRFKYTSGVSRKIAIILDHSDGKFAIEEGFIVLRPREKVDPEISCQLRKMLTREAISDLDIWYFATICSESMNYFNRHGEDSPDGWWQH